MFRNLLCVLLLAFCFSARGQITKSLLSKLSPDLARMMATKSSDSIDISVSVKKGFVIKAPLKVVGVPSPGFLYVIRLPLKDITLLAQNENVLFINRIYPPKEEVNTGASDPTLNLVTYTHHRFPSVRGNGIISSVKERLFDTTDIDLKGRIFFTGLENNTITSHASLMATIMAGAANSSPFAIGAAPAASLTSSSFTNLFPDPDSVFRNRRISVQNHSYGTVVENFYGNEAVAYDQQAFNNPQLLHVFSAGNAGTTTPASGSYTGLANTANLSGNFKQAKNILTVSAVDSLSQLLAASSRGPAYDGRVKPELVAYGEDGSSGAAALVSGASILVQHQFALLHGGGLPSSALTRAVLLNSADDIGAKNPDYQAGFGNLNTFAAVKTVAENRYLESSVVMNEQRTFAIDVPVNASRLKITLAWTDPPAQPNAAKALVNDLDLLVQSPIGESWQPWVLDPRPSPDILLQPATRAKDTLNNNEQVSIESPVAGTYTIEVKGSRLTTAAQNFSIAYEIDTVNRFDWSYPTASDKLVAGQRQVIRWRTNLSGSGRIDYSSAGENWRPVGTVDSLPANQLRWTVPDTVTQARLRLVTGNQIFLSDTFTINPQLSLQTGFQCADSVLLYWRSLGVQQYRLYKLGEKYLEPVKTVTDTALVLLKSQNPSLYYSIAPLLNGKEGLRSNTVNYANQGVGCYLRSFYLHSQTSGSALLIAELGTTYNVVAVRLEALQGSRFVLLQEVLQPQTTSFRFADVPVHPGENRFRLAIQLANGTVLYAEEKAFSVSDAMPVFVYPNPVAHGDVLKILVGEVGRYTLQVIDATGKLALQMELNQTVTTLPARRFSKGLHFLRILDKQGKARTHKQIIF